MKDSAQQFAEPALTALGRLLSRVLRHEPELVGIRLDVNGWVHVEDLLQGIRKATRSRVAPKRVRSLPPVTRELLVAVVATNSKQRFALSADGQRIRAVQGHSVTVDLGYPTLEPPPVLYHGTASASWRSIAAEGLNPGSRHAVHLSVDVETAKRVGSRHGRPVVLEVAAAQMHHDGLEFSRSDNGVWLTSSVPAKYLKLLS